MPELEIINQIFEVHLDMGDMEKGIKDAIEWDSFNIMNFMAEISDRYGITLDIVQISSIQYVKDMVALVKTCIQQNDQIV